MTHTNQSNGIVNFVKNWGKMHDLNFAVIKIMQRITALDGIFNEKTPQQ
jgi:hypothetical protein